MAIKSRGWEQFPAVASERTHSNRGPADSKHPDELQLGCPSTLARPFSSLLLPSTPSLLEAFPIYMENRALPGFLNIVLSTTLRVVSILKG